MKNCAKWGIIRTVSGMHSRQGWLGAYFTPEIVKKRCQHEGWQRFFESYAMTGADLVT
jgi:hypothetical protein